MAGSQWALIGVSQEIHPRRYVLLTPSWGFDGPTLRRVGKVLAESSDARWTASGDLLALARAWDCPFRR